MKYAICNELFGDWPLEKAFAYVAERGYKGIEIAPFTLGENVHVIDNDTRRHVRELAVRHGLTTVGLHWLLAKTEGYYLTHPDQSVREKTGDYFVSLTELCRDLGGTLMVLGSPQQRNLLPGVSHEQADDYSVDVIRRCLPALEKCGVTLALEPLGPSEGNFMLTAESAVRLIDRIDSPHVGLHLDVKAMSSEDKSIPEIIRDNASHLVHFHANDPNLRGPGMGAVDFDPIMAALREVNSDGWVSVEVFDYEAGVEKLATESIQNLCASWGRVG